MLGPFVWRHLPARILVLGAFFIIFGFWLNATCTTTATTNFGTQCIQHGWGLAGDIANSIVVLGIGLVLVGFVIWGLEATRAARMQTVVAPSEVDQYLVDGWRFVTTLPDGRVVLERAR